MTGSGQLHEVSLKIGELLANVEALAMQNHEARVDRRVMQEKLDGLTGDVKGLKIDVEEMKPSIQRYNTDRSRFMGGVAVVGSIFGAMASFGFSWLKKVFDV